VWVEAYSKNTIVQEKEDERQAREERRKGKDQSKCKVVRLTPGVHKKHHA